MLRAQADDSLSRQKFAAAMMAESLWLCRIDTPCSNLLYINAEEVEDSPGSRLLLLPCFLDFGSQDNEVGLVCYGQGKAHSKRCRPS